MSAACDICGRDLSDTFGPVAYYDVVIDIAIARRESGIERQFPAQNVIAWKGKMCLGCVEIAYVTSVTFERMRRERLEQTMPQARALAATRPWWRRLFGGA